MKGWLLLLKKQKNKMKGSHFLYASWCISFCVCILSLLNFIYYFFFLLSSFPTCTFCERRSNLLCFFFSSVSLIFLLVRLGGVVVTFSLPCLRSAWRRKKYESKRSDPLSLVFTLLLFPVSLPRATTSILHYTIHGIKYNKYLFTIN